MISSPQKALYDLFEFLGIDPMTIAAEQHKHKSRLPKVKLAQFMTRKVFGDNELFKVFAWINRRETPAYPPMSKKSWEFLNKEFQTWYPEIELITGLSTEQWQEKL